MYHFLDGEVLLIDKPLHWTSFDVVNKLKWTIKKNLGIKKIKIGHAGTLDPLASGLLIVCTGKKTKTIPEIQGQTKVYTGSIELGAVTPSYDLETEVEQIKDPSFLSMESLQKATEPLIGAYEQAPPIFSAKKINGKRAYDLARAGKQPELKKKLIEVKKFELTHIAMPVVEFEIVCSKGTYIRSIAHDFGQELGVGAYLKSLRRTQIGTHSVKNALSIETLVSQIEEMAVNKA